MNISDAVEVVDGVQKQSNIQLLSDDQVKIIMYLNIYNKSASRHLHWPSILLALHCGVFWLQSM